MYSATSTLTVYTQQTDPQVKVFYLKSGSFPGNNNLDGEVTTVNIVSVS